MTQKAGILQELRFAGTTGRTSTSLAFLGTISNWNVDPTASVRRAIGDLRKDGYNIRIVNGAYRLE